MRTKTHGKIKIDPELMAEFATSIGDNKYGKHSRKLFTGEQRTLVTEIYAKSGCNRKAFSGMFQEKYGICSNTLRSMAKREGIKIEKGRNW